MIPLSQFQSPPQQSGKVVINLGEYPPRSIENDKPTPEMPPMAGLTPASAKTSKGNRETKLKLRLRAGGQATLQVSDAFAETTTSREHQVTTYFDTSEGALSRRGLILCIREHNKLYTQTVKSRSNRRGLAVSRRQWDWQIRTEVPDISHLSHTQFLSRVAKEVDGKLNPVFRTDIDRTTYLLQIEGGTVVEAVFDEGSIVSGTLSEAVEELEPELKAGLVGPMYWLANRLQAVAPMWVSAEAKSARGWYLRTAQTEGGTTAKVPKLKRSGCGATAFGEMIENTLGHLASNIAPTLRGDPEGVHQVRGALRASRATPELFEPYLDQTIVKEFDSALNSFGKIFGSARDWDVFCLLTMPQAIQDVPTQRLWDLRQAAEKQRQLAYAAVAEAVRGRELTATILGLAAWTATEAAKPLPFGSKHMQKRFSALAPTLLDLVERKAQSREHDVLEMSAKARHNLRKSLDKLCDNVKSMEHLFNSSQLRRYRRKCEAVQALLGMANDAEVAEQLAESLITQDRPDLRVPADSLRKWSDQRKHTALQGI